MSMYKPVDRRKSMENKEIGCAIALLGLQVVLAVAPVAFGIWVIVVLLKHFGVI